MEDKTLNDIINEILEEVGLADVEKVPTKSG